MALLEKENSSRYRITSSKPAETRYDLLTREGRTKRLKVACDDMPCRK